MGCARRECHPGSSGHMAVPVEGAADPPFACIAEDGVEQFGELAVAVPHQELRLAAGVLADHAEIFAAAPARACQGGDGTRESGSLVGERDRCERLTRLLHAQDEKSAVNLRYPGGEILTRKTREQARDRVGRSGASGALLPLARNRGPLLPSWRSSRVLR